jgi:hypothetical protein
MKIINLAHPLTTLQLEQIQEYLDLAFSDEKIEKVLHIPVQFDVDKPFEPQVEELLQQIPDEPCIINPPSLNFIAWLVASRLKRRDTKYWIIRLKRVDGDLIRFELAEIIEA